MVGAGAKVRKPPPRPDFFDGYHAYIETPDGTVWELVHNPGFHFAWVGSAFTPGLAPCFAEAQRRIMRTLLNPVCLAIEVYLLWQGVTDLGNWAGWALANAGPGRADRYHPLLARPLHSTTVKRILTPLD